MRIEDIEKVFDNLLGIQGKCMTLDRIREKLGELSQTEKNDLLSDKLNEAEKDHYNWLLKDYQQTIDFIEEYENAPRDKYPEGMVDSLLKEFKKDKKEKEENLFYYEKRIYNNHKLKKPKTPPKVDLDKYYEEIDHPEENVNNVIYERLEKSMIANQVGVDFSDENIDALQGYFTDESWLLNSRLNNGKKWNDLSKEAQEYKSKELDKLDKDLSDAISKTDGLPYPAKLYHFAEFDISKVVGDKITFKGYTSATFQKYVAETWGDTYRGNKTPKYTYELLLDTGTKGVCANNSRVKLTSLNYEHELLLGKGISGDIVNIDVENHIVTVKVDG